MLISKTEHLECIFRDRGGELLLVTFNEMGMSANGDRLWGDDPAQKLNLSIVGFVSTKPNWFPAADMYSCIEILEEILAGRTFKRITFGLSQGGYAALKYSRVLKSEINIAFSPQASISPEDVQDTRFHRFYDQALHKNMKITPEDVCGSSYVFYDPYDRTDAAHCAILANSIPAHFVRLPFAGHGSIRAFRGTAHFETILRNCMNRDIPAILRHYNSVKTLNANRPYYMVMELIQKHPRLALKIFEKYRSERPASAWIEACFRFSHVGYGQEVVGWVRDNADSKPKDHAAQACAALVSLRINDPQAALTYITRALELLPGHPPYEHTKHSAEMMTLRLLKDTQSPSD